MDRKAIGDRTVSEDIQPPKEIVRPSTSAVSVDIAESAFLKEAVLKTERLTLGTITETQTKSERDPSQGTQSARNISPSLDSPSRTNVEFRFRELSSDDDRAAHRPIEGTQIRFAPFSGSKDHF